MKIKKRNNVIIAVCLLAFILAAIVGVLFSTYQPSTVASAEAAVDCVSEDPNDGIMVLASKAHCPDCGNNASFVRSESATCTSGGSSVYYCDYCDEEFVSYDYSALGHDYSVHVETVTGTCQTEGYVLKKCSRCSSTQKTSTGYGTHDYSVFAFMVVEATCSTEGSSAYKCSKCSSTKSFNIGYGDHKMIDVNIAATCTSAGKTGQSCAYCSQSTVNETPALGHDYSVFVECTATCSESGSDIYKCSRCDSTRESPPYTLDHQYAERETPATCNKGGKIEKYCTVCGTVTETQDTEPTYDHEFGHSETVGATCTLPGIENYYCANCGEVYMFGDIPELGHDFSIEIERVEYCEILGYIKYKCTRCSETNTETLYSAGHDKELIETVEPTCTDEGFTHYKCRRCQEDFYEDYSIMLGHDREERVLEQANCGFFGRVEVYCSRCGEVFEEYTVDPTYEHNNILADVEAADCVTPGQEVYECTVCGARHYELLSEPLGHDFSVELERFEYCDKEGYVDYVCTRCPQTTFEVLEPLGHDYENQIEYHAADCENKEVAIYQCVRCDSTTDKGTAKALGHDVSQRKILEASGDYPAIYERYCTRCGEVFETLTGEQIFDEGNQDDNNQGGDNQGDGSGNDNQGDDNQGGGSDEESPAPAPKVNALKILKMCLSFAYLWIAFGLCILFFVLFIKRSKE